MLETAARERQMLQAMEPREWLRVVVVVASTGQADHQVQAQEGNAELPHGNGFVDNMNAPILACVHVS